jgi:pimeloyl-ACP methyl ester carboxylesterase
LHGLVSNSTRWWRLGSSLGGWKLLRPDLRGHAGSHDRGRIGVAEWCADLARLLDAEGCGRAVVGGHCLGANIALHFAARYPERTAGLLLIEPMPREALIGSMQFLYRIRYLPRILACIAHGANQLGLKRKHIESVDLEQWDQAVARGEIALATFASPFSDLRLTPSAAYFQGVCGLLEPLPAPAAIRCPALVLLSRNSQMTDAARTRAAMEKLADAEILGLPAEHWIPTEQPEAMRKAIEDWLGRKLTALP